jgi:glycosyltransferase involved in cell wall biosynthesis
VDAIVLRNPGRERRYQVNGVNVICIQKREHNEKRKSTYLIRLLTFLIRSAVVLSWEHVKNPYRLVHLHSIPDFEVFAAIIPKITGAKIILDIHDIVPELFLSKFGARANTTLFKLLLIVERASACFADHLIIANDIWLKRMISRSVPEKKCTTIMNYPVPEIFGGKRRTRGQDSRLIMLYPGTLSRHQGIDTAIKAIDIVKNELPELVFHIYGKGTDEDQLKGLARQLNLQGRVEFFSPLPLEKIAEVMANADFGVEPKLRESFSDEAFSTKILEFMYLGIPVIASNTTVHKYYVADDLVKYFNAGDPQDLADAIRTICNNKLMRQQLVEKSAKFIKEYSWDYRKKVYLDLVGITS